MPSLSPLLNLLFPPRCAGCKDFVAPGAALCAECERNWPSLGSPCCGTCAEPFVSGPDHRCAKCLANPPSYDRLRAAGVYEGLLLDLIVRLKYRGEERLASFLAERMASVLKTAEVACDLILPIPLHLSRLRERGFNQAALIAKKLGRLLNAPVELFTLRKLKPTAPQATLHVDERRKNLSGAFGTENEAALRGRRVLLVDDVATTGATLHEAARALKKAGAERVEAAVAARAI